MADLAFLKAKSGGLFVPSPQGLAGFQRQGMNQTKKASGTTPTVLDPASLANNGGPGTLSASGLVLTQANAGGGFVARGIGGKSSGKHHFEVTVAGGVDAAVGIVSSALAVGSIPATDGGMVGAALLAQWNGGVFVNSNTINPVFAANNPTWTNTQTVGLDLDLDNKRMWVRGTDAALALYNNSGTADPASNIGGLDISALALPVQPLLFVFAVGQSETANFGGKTFVLPVPVGFNPGWLV